MIFKDKLKDVHNSLATEFEKLFKLAWDNQSFPTDLLLIVANGWHDPSLEGMKTSKGKPMSQYVVGPGSEGHSDETHYTFIHDYRQKFSEYSLEEYLKLHVWSSERREEIDALLSEEEMTIHLETLVYLKIWEGDFFIKRWFQFVQALNGESYDWHFKIQNSNRDVGNGTRQDLIRKQIRDRIKPFSEPIFDSFKTAYQTQIRNAIAHSNFSFLGRNMHLHNYVKEDPASQLHNLEFDNWIEMFHTTLVLHNFSIWLKDRINTVYAQMFEHNPESALIRITKEDGTETFYPLMYIPEREKWTWKR